MQNAESLGGRKGGMDVRQADTGSMYGKQQGWRSPVLIRVYLCAGGLLIRFLAPRVKTRSILLGVGLSFLAVHWGTVTKALQRIRKWQ